MDLTELENKTRNQIEFILNVYSGLNELAGAAIRLGKEYNINPNLVASMLMMNLQNEAEAKNNNE